MKLCKNCGAPIGNEMSPCCEAMTPRHGTARSDAGFVRVQRVGRRSDVWTAELPRAAGVWWWWCGNENIRPDIVEVTNDTYPVTPMTVQWPGLTRRRYTTELKGWWCGPLDYPEPPPADRPPTEKLTDSPRET